MFVFKRNFKVYIDFKDTGPALRVPITELNFSRVFEEKEIKTKTLHDQNYYSYAKITKSFPANFSFSVELTLTSALDKLFAKCTIPTLMDIYLESDGTYFTFTNAIIDNTTINLEYGKTITLNISGTSAILIPSKTAPAVTRQEDTFSRNLVSKVDYLDITFNGELINSVSSISLEIANESKWLEHKTVHSTLNTVTAINTPTTAVITGKRVSGNFSTAYTGDDSDPENFFDGAYVGIPILIEVKFAGNTILTFNLTNCVCTSRLEVDSVLKRAYDFRLTITPSSLFNIIDFDI